MGKIMGRDFVSTDDVEDLLGTAESVCGSRSTYTRILAEERTATREVIDPRSITSASHIAEVIRRDFESD